MKKDNNYLARQKAWIEANDINMGDKLLVRESYPIKRLRNTIVKYIDNPEDVFDSLGILVHYNTGIIVCMEIVPFYYLQKVEYFKYKDDIATPESSWISIPNEMHLFNPTYMFKFGVRQLVKRGQCKGFIVVPVTKWIVQF